LFENFEAKNFNSVKVEQDLKTFDDFEREAEEEMGLPPYANDQGAQGLAHMRWEQYKKDNNIQESIRKIVREGFRSLLKESAETEQLSVEQIFEDWLKKQEWFDFWDENHKRFRKKDGYDNRMYGEINEKKPPIKDFLKKGDVDEINKSIKNYIKEQFSQLKKIFEEKGYDFYMDSQNLWYHDQPGYYLNFEFSITRENGDDYFSYDLKGSFKLGQDQLNYQP
jgi:hypothetical protein